MEKFKNLGISEATLSALKTKGFEEPTPIQEQAIPLLLKGEKDIIGQAQTGTGKTAAFGIPIIERAEANSKHVQALILAPTRELAIQVADELNELKGNKKLSIIPVYGGQAMKLQLDRLKRGVDVVVGTPGRVMDHLKRKTLKLDHAKYIVLDEADEMLNMGFVDDVEMILGYVGKERQMMLFSATMPKPILKLAQKYMRDYEVISVKKEQLTTPLTDQIYFEVKSNDRFDALCRIIDVEKEFYGLIFCRTRVETDKLAKRLDERGYGAEAIHGDVSQPQREKILKKFRDRRIHILTATDVAARGIDINDLTHVINYGLPQDPESYVHRIGRTGRAGKQGTAITFITPSEFRRLSFIKKAANAEIRKGQLPTKAEALETRLENVKQVLEEVINKKEHKDFLNLAGGLLETHQPEDIVAALLKHIFKVEEEVKTNDGPARKRTRDEQERDSNSVEKSGKTRLYVSMGKKDGLSIGKLTKFIQQETGVAADQVRGVEIFKNFSFINVPFEEAEKILAVFQKKYGKNTPLVEKAKEPKGSGGNDKGRKKGRKRTSSGRSS